VAFLDRLRGLERKRMHGVDTAAGAFLGGKRRKHLLNIRQ